MTFILEVLTVQGKDIAVVGATLTSLAVTHFVPRIEHSRTPSGCATCYATCADPLFISRLLFNL